MKSDKISSALLQRSVRCSDAEPHNFYAAPGTIFDAAPAPTLLDTKPIFLKQTKLNIKIVAIFSSDILCFKLRLKVNRKSMKLLQFVKFL
jgi:hypothetical protein